MSFTRPAGRTSNRLSILSSPISGKSIRSLLCAKKPAAMMPKRLPRRKMAVFLRLRVFGRWWTISAVSPGFAGLSSRGAGVGDSEVASLSSTRRRRVLAISDCAYRILEVGGLNSSNYSAAESSLVQLQTLARIVPSCGHARDASFVESTRYEVQVIRRALRLGFVGINPRRLACDRRTNSACLDICHPAPLTGPHYGDLPRNASRDCGWSQPSPTRFKQWLR